MPTLIKVVNDTVPSYVNLDQVARVEQMPEGVTVYFSKPGGSDRFMMRGEAAKNFVEQLEDMLPKKKTARKKTSKKG